MTCCKISKQKNPKWIYYFLKRFCFFKVFSIFINFQNIGSLNERFYLSLGRHLILCLTLKLAATKQEAVETKRNARNHFYDIHLGSSINYVFSFSQHFDPSHPHVTTFLHGYIDQFFSQYLTLPTLKRRKRYLWTTTCALLRAAQCLGSFNNYVDIILIFFDHLPLCGYYPEGGQKFYLPTSSCPRSFWTTHCRNFTHYLLTQFSLSLNPSGRNWKTYIPEATSLQWCRKLPQVGRASNNVWGGGTICPLWLR